MAQLQITLTTNDSAQSVLNLVSSAPKNRREFLATMGDLSGTGTEVKILNADSVAASTVLTVDNSTIAANDVILIGDISYTAKASGASGHQFNIAGSSTLTAAAIATLFNANSADFGGKVVATPSGATVIFMFTVPGVLGNLLSTSVSIGTPGALAFTGTRFANGADDSAVSKYPRSFKA